MGNKTLEYMGERVDKARKLVKDIATINGKIKNLSSDDIAGVGIFLRHGAGVYLGKYKDSPETEHILPEIKVAVINVLENHRDSLQRELDEL